MAKLQYCLLFSFLAFEHVYPVFGWWYDKDRHACVSFGCECRGEFVEGCNCECIGILDDRCVRNCGPRKFTQYGKCVNRCDVNYMQYGTSCVKTCPPQSYASMSVPAVCKQCHSECNGCFGPTNTECNVCRHLYYNGTCQKDCPESMVIYNGRCITRTSCIWYIQDKTCVQACPTGMYGERAAAGEPDICRKCHRECITCSGPGNNDCGSCRHFNASGFCLEKCPDTLPYTSGNQCLYSCGENQVLYGTVCRSKCPPGWLQSADKCVIACPPDSEYIKGESCVNTCDGVLWKKRCLQTCPPNTGMYMGSCVTACPPQLPFIENRTCVEECTKVSFRDKCFSACPGNRPHLKKTCVLQCPPAHHFIDPISNECSSECKHILFGQACLLKCPSPLSLFGTKCLRTCPKYTLQFKGICYRKCPQRKFTLDNHCVHRCPKGLFSYEELRLCLKTCPNLASLEDWKCVDKCPGTEPFIKDSICRQSCERRLPNEGTLYTKGNECLYKCPDNMYVDGKSCVNECPYNTHTNGSDCVKDNFSQDDYCKMYESVFKLFICLSLILWLPSYVAVYCGVLCIKSAMDDLVDIRERDGMETEDVVTAEGMNGQSENDTEDGDANIRGASSSAENACEEYKFDVFIIHSSEDRAWVVEALHILEGEPYNLKCCYSQRDFVPGYPIIRSIEDNINKSKCIILVLSPNYMTSGWCEQEQDLAITMAIIKPGTIIVPVLLEPCDIPHTLKMTNYIDVSLGDWDKKLVSRIREGRKKQSSPYERLEGVLDNVLARRDGPVNYDPPVLTYSLKANCCRSYDFAKGILQQAQYLAKKGIKTPALAKSISRLIFSAPVLERAWWKGFMLHLFMAAHTAIFLILYGSFGCIRTCHPLCKEGLSIPPVILMFHVLITLMRSHWLKREIIRKAAVDNWWINENHGLILGWDRSIKSISYTIQDLKPCKDYIADSQAPVLRTLLRRHENAPRKEITPLKSYLYEYSVGLLCGYDGVVQHPGHRHVARFDRMCFCEFLEWALQRDHEKATKCSFFSRKYQPLVPDIGTEDQTV